MTDSPFADHVRIWRRNTVVIVGLVLVGAIATGFDGPRFTAVLIGGALLEVWNTVTVLKAWLFTGTYRWFWWWRR